MGEDERGEMEADRERAREALAAAPAPVREAIAANDVEALTAALESLPEEEAARVVESLGRAGVLAPSPSASGGPDMAEILRTFDPFLHAAAAVARGDDEPRAAVEAALPDLEENGWQLAEAVRRIWAGERDAEALTAEVDPNSAGIIRRVLELIEAPTPEEALAAAPAPIREAIEADDVESLKAELEAMPQEEAARVFTSLRDSGVLQVQ